MAAVEVTISGMLYDKLARTTQNVVLIGEASLTGLGVGGGPVIPPPGSGPVDPGYGVPVPPVMIWGGRPGPWDGSWVPPQPPIPPTATPPSPGDPTTPLPPPPGSGGWPVQPVVPPPYIVVNYPGIGPVVVAPPAPPPEE